MGSKMRTENRDLGGFLGSFRAPSLWSEKFTSRRIGKVSDPTTSGEIPNLLTFEFITGLKGRRGRLAFVLRPLNHLQAITTLTRCVITARNILGELAIGDSRNLRLV